MYNIKKNSYFSGARKDWVDSLPNDERARILEIGCGNGDTGAYALNAKKCGEFYGVEINETAGLEAKTKLTNVVIGDVEKLDLNFAFGSFDILMMSEVLEHLIYPWIVLRKLCQYMKPGALIFSSSPNISNYKAILMLLKGKWQWEDEGLMDITHLRWFTPDTYARMFQECGYIVDEVRPVTPFGFKKKMISLLTLKKIDHLFMTQIDLRGHCSS